MFVLMLISAECSCCIPSSLQFNVAFNYSWVLKGAVGLKGMNKSYPDY
jgi:hypothetical protein